MIICESLKEARAVDGVVHIEVLPEGAGAIAYQFGDELPDRCRVDPNAPQPRTREQQLNDLTDVQFQKLMDLAKIEGRT